MYKIGCKTKSHIRSHKSAYSSTLYIYFAEWFVASGFKIYYQLYHYNHYSFKFMTSSNHQNCRLQNSNNHLCKFTHTKHLKSDTEVQVNFSLQISLHLTYTKACLTLKYKIISISPNKNEWILLDIRHLIHQACQLQTTTDQVSKSDCGTTTCIKTVVTLLKKLI
jgi:hypothetical protein